MSRIDAIPGARAGLERAFGALRAAMPTLAVAAVLDATLFQLGLRAGLYARDAQWLGYAALLSLLAPRVARALPAAGRLRSAGRLAVIAVLALPLRTALLAFGMRVPGPGAWIGLAAGAVLAGASAVAAAALWPARPAGDEPGRPQDVALLGALAYWLVLRSVWLGLPELLPDEAYHWTWATHLALGYLDHPPLTGWTIAGATALLGKSELSVRVFAWLAGGVTVVSLYVFGRQLYGRAVGLRCALLGALLPFYFAVGVAMMPDSLVFACWSAGLALASRALLAERRRAWWGLGVCLGLGFLAKYTVALLAAGIVTFVLVDRRSRAWLRRPEPWLGAGVALALATPVWVWNLQHDWASFAFQTTRRLDRSLAFAIPDLFLHGALLLSPPGLLAALWALWPGPHGLLAPRPGEDAGDERRIRRFLWTLTGVALLPFVLHSIFHHPRAHWTAPAWLALLPVLARTLPGGGARDGVGGRLLRGAWAPMLVVLVAFYGLGLQHVVMGVSGVPYGRLFDRYFWREAVPEVERQLAILARETGQAPVLGSNTKWSIAASLSFYGPPEWQDTILSRHLFGEQASMWSYWNPVEPAIGRPLLLLGRDVFDLRERHVLATLEGAGPVEIVTLVRDGVALRHLYFRRVQRYRGPPGRAP